MQARARFVVLVFIVVPAICMSLSAITSIFPIEFTEAAPISVVVMLIGFLVLVLSLEPTIWGPN